MREERGEGRGGKRGGRRGKKGMRPLVTEIPRLTRNRRLLKKKRKEKRGG